MRHGCHLVLVLVVSLLTGLAACGDNLGTGADAAGDDTSPDGPIGPDGPPATAGRAVIVSGDFAASGIVSTLDVPERTMTQGAVDGVAGIDPVIRRLANDPDHLYVVNRTGGDNVTIIDADTLTLVDQMATGASSNPQDVAVVGTKVYVAALGETGVIVFDRSAGNARTEIDLGSLDPGDGHPDCVSIYAVGTRLFVACGLLDAFVPTGPGKVAVIDATTDTLVDTLTLPAENPFSLFARTPTDSLYAGDLVIGTVPSFSDFSTGCLARISVGATPAANGCVKTNAELGGYANHIEASLDGAILWVAVDGFTLPAFDAFGMLRGIDLESGLLWDGAVSAPTEVITDLTVCPGDFVVGADTAAGAKGLRVWHGTTEVTTAPLAFGLPPAYGGNMVCVPR